MMAASALQFDVCIPVYRNLKCFDLAVRGWRKHVTDPESIRKFLLHVQDPAEMELAVRIVSNQNFDAEVVSVGKEPVNMVHPMNALFAACRAPWAVFTEQDVFLSDAPDSLVSGIRNAGFAVAGPVDTFFYDNINSRQMPHYGQYGRLSGEPGHYHSSFIVMNRQVVADRSKTPFSIPEGYLERFHCYGCLGGEMYYGLRINVEETREQLGFFRQTHGGYGYSAELSYQGKAFAHHLYYSSRQNICANPISPAQIAEVGWIKTEEERFLSDYKTRLDSDGLP